MISKWLNQTVCTQALLHHFPHLDQRNQRLTYTHSHTCIWVNAITHRLIHIQYKSMHLLCRLISSSQNNPPLHSLMEIAPPGNTGVVQVSQNASDFFQIYVKMFIYSHPAIHLSFPPTTVALLGEDLDGVSFPQRELWAVLGWVVIAGPRYTKALHTAPCETEPTLQHRRA